MIQVLPPVRARKLPAPVMSRVEVPWVVKVPVPERVLVAVTLKGPVTVTLPLPARVPPERVRGVATVVSLLRLRVPLETLMLVPVAAIPRRPLAWTVAPETTRVPAPVMLEPALSVRVPDEKARVVPVATL